jgi:hypothetical protein
MKKITTLLLLSIAFQSFAIDRFVDPNLSAGNGTTLFTNITSAVNAAVNGDRIIVASSSYNEGVLNISKSLKIIPQTAGTIISYNGNIVVSGFSGMNLEIIGFNLGTYNLQNNDFSGTDSSYASVSVINCVFNAVIFNSDFYSLNMFECTTNSLIFKSGYVVKSHIINSFRVEDEVGSMSTSNRKIKIIANDIDSDIYIYNDNFQLLIANNDSGGVNLQRWNPSSNVTNVIHNNNFTGGFHITSRNVPRYNIIVTSNIFGSNFCVANNPNNYYKTGLDFNNPGTALDGLFCQGSTNEFPNPNVPGFFEWSYNAGVTFGYPTVGSSSPLSVTMIAGNSTSIDSGNPNHKYYDINLTLNDVGKMGGPYSQLNYTATNSNNSRAFIFDIEMPVDLFPGQNVEIKAKGYHSN